MHEFLISYSHASLLAALSKRLPRVLELTGSIPGLSHTDLYKYIVQVTLRESSPDHPVKGGQETL